MAFLAVLVGGATFSSRWAHSGDKPMEPLPVALPTSPPSVAQAAGGHAGAQSCASCHPAEYRHWQRDGKFMVRTDGPDGQLRDYQIAYTFGVYPLQQYLNGFRDGRYQALGIAWDSRPKEQGGQRWFHLYPDQNLMHKDPLHWTGLQQSWNHMCAECHSTNLRKNYDAQAQPL